MVSDEDFDSSPRPVKKRRVTAAKPAKKPATKRQTPKASGTNGGAVKESAAPASPIAKPKRGRPRKVIIDSDDDASIIPAPAQTSQARKKVKDAAEDDDEVAFDPTIPVKKTRARKKKQQTRIDSDDDGSIVSTPLVKRKSRTHTPFDEYDDDGYAKPQKPKYAIHVPAKNNLKDVYLDSNAPPPSTNPWEIRGAIWKKDLPAAKSVFDVVPTTFARQSTGPEIAQRAQHDLSRIDPTTKLTANRIGSIARSMDTVRVVKQSDIPESNSDQSPKDWVQLDVDPAKPDTGRHPSALKPSDIPNSDDLDPEDWAQFHDDYAKSSGKARMTTQGPSPHHHVSSQPVTEPILNLSPPTKVPSQEEPVEDSLMIDDLDPDDWDMLEINNVLAANARSSARKDNSTAANSALRVMEKPVTSEWSAPPDNLIRTEDPMVSSRDPLNEVVDELSEGVSDDSFPPSRPHAESTTKVTAAEAVRISLPPETFVDELADLPSDAFDDSDASSPLSNPNEVVYVSSQNGHAPIRKPNMTAPRNGLVQTTLFGSKARPHDAATVANKKHAWPLATQKEADTHHRLDPDAVNTWVYPTNLGTIRDYQYNIVARGLFHNLLVALPTGLGKTFIAATIMLNWFRWAPDSQIVFVAPTKPLVAQQIDACFKVVGIPRSETVMLTGETKPAIRAEEWKEKRVFFMTPQTIINDLKLGYCDPKRIVLVVVDEAHRATGGYAYVEVIKFLRRFNQSFRVLALTATPGSTVEAVQQVIDGLDISRVEIRTETSIDIRQYVHARDIDTMKFDFSDEQNMIMELLSKAIQPVLTKLNGQNAYWVKDPMKLTAYGCNMAQRQWMSEAGKRAPPAIKGMVASIFPVLASLGHGISLLKFHGVGPFYRNMTEFRNNVDGGKTRGKYALQIRQDENFNKMMNTMQTWTRNPDFLGHPKLEYLRRVVLNHFMDSKTETRIMIFAHFRDSAEEIVRVMKRNEPMIRPHAFVGQASAKTSEGMGQKRQLEVIQQFKEGKFNTLVATSIGEEGLDIGEVDLIVCYDASSSPIRMLQRMGRTGRKRKGNIVLLLMRGKEEDDFEKAKDNYEKMQAMISEGTRFTFHDDKSPRILPRGTNPVVDRRVVEIPIENSQADLPEPNRRKRVPKRPPKKFHMPDNVQTGFVSASRMGESDQEEENVRLKKTKPSRKKAGPVTIAKARATTPEPEGVALPFLNDVLLNKVQERELERKYQYVNGEDGNVPTVTAPRLDKLSLTFPGPTRLVRHGRGTLAMAGMMQRICDMNSDRIQSFKDNLRLTELPSDVDHLVEEPEQNDAEGDADLPELPTVPNKRGPRKRKVVDSTAIRRVSKPAASRAKPGSRVQAARLRQNSSDMEGDASEPEPTPANMRIATQGIDLGSDDTAGEEDDEEEPDSQLAAFVVGSDAPIETFSSSMPYLRSDSDEGEADDVRVVSPIRKRLQRGTRQVIDDDSDD